MADTHHEPINPDAAPMHSEVKEDFSRLQVAIAIGLGLVATVGGIVFGLLLAND